MIKTIGWHVFRFVFFVFLQALVVNNIDVSDGWVLPFIYPFALLMLPTGSARWLTMVLGFVIGFMLDSFTHTWGMHTSACVLVGFLQPLVLRLIAPREGYDPVMRPTVQDMGLNWYIAYAFLLMLPFHLWLGYIEVFSLDQFLVTLGRAGASALAAVLLMVLGQYLMFTPKAASL